MPSGAVHVCLGIGHAGPGLVAKLLPVDELPWFSHKGHHLETTVSSGKYTVSLFVGSGFFSPYSTLSSGRLIVSPCRAEVVLRLRKVVFPS